MTGPTRPLPRDPDRPPRDPRPARHRPAGTRAARPSRPGRGLGVTGVFAGGLVVLALSLVVAWIVATRLGVPGPEADLLAWHGFAAVAVAVAQVHGDRTGRARIPLAVSAVALVVLVVLWFA